MSDHKPNEQQNNAEMRELYALLNRLEKRDEVRRYQEFTKPSTELITTPEEKKPIPARFQPNNLTDTDLGSLLLTDFEESLEAQDKRSIQEIAPLPTNTDEELPEPPATKRNPFKALWSGFLSNFPRKGDSTGVKVRKCGFLTSLLVMLLAIIYLVVDLVILPARNEKLKEELIALYHPEKSEVQITKEQAEKGNYPVNMLASFTDLYKRNKEVRGWIEYKATGKEDFLNIEYPIVYSGDNSKYLKKDFDGKTSKYGTLFFDKKNEVNHYTDTNRSLIVYGHDMVDGQMFGGMHKLLGNVQNARAAATLSMSTLFRSDEYKVFAVILTDEDDKKQGRYFNTRRTSFEDDENDEDFLNYVDEMRARSLFDYPVDVEAGDQLLVLSTCTRKSSAKIKNGRLVVVARRVREGESATVDTSKIQKNSDVIMPYYWYINQKKTPHKYYRDNGTDTEQTQTTGSSRVPTLPTGSMSGISTMPTGTDTTDSTVGTESTDVINTTTSTTSTTKRPSTSHSSTTSTTQSTATTPSTTPSTAACAHVYDAGTVIKASSCTEKGEIQFSCTMCGASYTESVPTLPHSFSGCGSKCETCDTYLVHKWDQGVVNQQASCDKPGEIVYTCTLCGEEHCDMSAHNAGDSQPLDIRKETCVEAGEAWYKCQDCGELFLKDIPPIGYHVDKDGNNQCDGCGEYVEE